MIHALLVALLAAPADVTIVTPTLDPAVASRRAALVEGAPALRGFRAPMLEDAARLEPIAAPDAATDPKGAAAAELVARRLAKDGLIATLARVVEILGPDRFATSDAPDLLRSVGIPYDWTTYFEAPGAPSVVRALASELAAGRTSDELVLLAAKFPFRFRPTVPGFVVATESGENEPAALRLQIGNDHYYTGPGDGGTVDLPRALVTTLPDLDVVAVIRDAHVDGFRAIARDWTLASGTRLTLVPQPWAVSQWSQDNGKAGFVGTGGARTVVLLAPRYAGRGESAPNFVPGDTFAVESFAATGRRVAQSPLLFQGGNVIAVFDPKRGQPQLVMGEAELYRNMGLGLTSEQVLAAFRAEFGVERCLVVPATSFHVDYEMTFRSTPDGLVAFLNDSSAGHRAVLRCAVPALERAGLIGAEDKAALVADMDAGAWDKVLQGLDGLIGRKEVALGVHPESFARHFSDGGVDPGNLNLQRVLLALDVLFVERRTDAEIDKLGIDAHAAAYLKSIRRREVERIRTAQILADQGIRIVWVPSTSEGSLSLTAINGVQVRGAYWMPAYGGLFADLDRAAARVFEMTLGSSVRVIPVPCAESQRRDGALHCSISVLPRP